MASSQPRKLTLETIFQFFNVCAAICLFSHSSFFLQTFFHLYNLFLPLFRNSFYAFLLLNVIILFLFALSNNLFQQQSPTLPSSHNKLTTTSHSHSPLFEKTVTAVTETTTESYERRMVVAPPKRCNSSTGLRCVEQLSEEEFNRAVEEFIAMHKKMQWEEQIGIGSFKTGYLAYTPPSN